MEVRKIQRRLTLRTSAVLTAVGTGKATAANTYTGQLGEAAADSVVMVTARAPDEQLFLDLLARRERNRLAPRHRRRVGPGTIAAAIWSGRRLAEEFDAELPSNDVVPFRREVTPALRGPSMSTATGSHEPMTPPP